MKVIFLMWNSADYRMKILRRNVKKLKSIDEENKYRIDALFEKAGSPRKNKNECEKFYRPYFKSDGEMKDFFVSVFQNDEEDKTPRRILNQICRFVSLANDIVIIRPDRDPLRIFFLRMGLESIYKIVGVDNGKCVGNFFEKFVSEEGKQYILNNFRFLYLEPGYSLNERERFFDDCSYYNLTIGDFSRIFYVIRGMVAHEGEWWTIQIFAKDDRWDCLTDMTTDKKLIDGYESRKGYPINYHFETTMQYEKFIDYFTEGCIAFLKKYLSDGKKNFMTGISR